MAVRGDENVREKSSVSGRRTEISCDGGPRGSQCLQNLRKRKAKEVQELDEFEVRMKVVKSETRMTPGKKAWSKWEETRKDPNKPWYESSGLSPREGSTQSKSRTKCTKRCGWSSGYFEPHPRQRSLQRVLLAKANFAEQRYHFVLRGTTQGPWQET